MEGDPINDWEMTATNNDVNLVIVGKAGTGKSAVGNCILGRKAFLSKRSPVGVTSTSELQRTVKEGRVLNVIDTPGLFDVSAASEIIREIVRCIDLAKDGIHAVLLVISAISRFTKEEEDTIECMKSLFGDEIYHYMIVVFTGGDTLVSEGMMLMDYISLCPEPLMNVLKLCKHRAILFDNITEDMNKREKQVNDLLSLVETVIADNGGKPFSDKIFSDLKEGAILRYLKVKELEDKVECSKEEFSEIMKELNKSYKDQLKHITEMIEEKLEMLRKQLAEEEVARQVAERLAKASLEESGKKIGELKEELNRAKTDSEEMKRKLAEHSNCVIL